MPLVREMPASERPREKMLAQGAAALSNTLRFFGLRMEDGTVRARA